MRAEVEKAVRFFLDRVRRYWSGLKRGKTGPSRDLVRAFYQQAIPPASAAHATAFATEQPDDCAVNEEALVYILRSRVEGLYPFKS